MSGTQRKGGTEMDIGSKIRQARITAGYTQEQAAEELCVSRQTISNWENAKTYPDIVSVIRMSDLYDVRLDDLLKEEKEVKERYVDYLRESTDTVKSHERLTKGILLAQNLILYTVVQLVFWFFAKGSLVPMYKTVFQYVLLPMSVLILGAFAGHGNWWGKRKWLLTAVCGALFALVPSVSYVSGETEAALTFLWPSFLYLPLGAFFLYAGVSCGQYYAC